VIGSVTGQERRTLHHLGTGQMSTGSKDGRRSVNQKTGPNQTPQMPGGRMRARITGYLTCPQEHDAWRQDAVAYLRLFDLSPRAPLAGVLCDAVIGEIRHWGQVICRRDPKRGVAVLTC
jgi:hypothetical protein